MAEPVSIVDYSDSEGESDRECVIVLNSDNESDSGESDISKQSQQAKLDFEWEQVRLIAQHGFDVQWEILRERQRRHGRKVVVFGVIISYEYD